MNIGMGGCCHCEAKYEEYLNGISAFSTLSSGPPVTVPDEVVDFDSED